MARDTARRSDLAEAAADYVLRHGLIGLSLRPLAAELGTSDRMLLYHFAGKDDLIATVLRAVTDRSVTVLRALPPSAGVRQAVLDLWRLTRTEQVDRCQRVYVEAAALGLFGREPYVSVVTEANERWVAALADHLVASGGRAEVTRRAVSLLDAAFMGLQLDLPLEPDPDTVEQVVGDVADTVAAVLGQGPVRGPVRGPVQGPVQGKA